MYSTDCFINAYVRLSSFDMACSRTSSCLSSNSPSVDITSLSSFKNITCIEDCGTVALTCATKQLVSLFGAATVLNAGSNNDQPRGCALHPNNHRSHCTRLQLAMLQLQESWHRLATTLLLPQRVADLRHASNHVFAGHGDLVCCSV